MDERTRKACTSSHGDGSAPRVREQRVGGVVGQVGQRWEPLLGQASQLRVSAGVHLHGSVQLGAKRVARTTA